MSRTPTMLVALTTASLSVAACNDSVAPNGSTAHIPRLNMAIENSSDWSPPQNLGPVLNISGFNTRNAAISRNGKSLYFGSDRPGGAGALDIYVSHRRNPNAPWGPPTNLGLVINTGLVDNNPYPTPDGHHLYFTSSRPGGSGGPDLWVTHRDDVHDDAGWKQPTNLGSTINTPFQDSGPVYFVDPATGGAMIFFSSTRPGGQGSADFYMSTLGSDGAWGPGVIIPELNTPFDDNKLAVRADGLELFLSSNRPGGGQDAMGFNIWVSTRATTQDAWALPVLAVESAGLPAISTNGKELYMVARQPGSGIGGVPFKNDLYLSTRRGAP